MSKKGLLSLTGLASGLYLCLAMGAAEAGPVPTGLSSAATAAAAQTEEVQFRRRGGGRVIGGGGGRRIVGGGGRRFGGRGVGAGIAAGVIGGLIGGALLNPGPVYAAPQPVYEAPPVYVRPGGGSVEYCMQRYRSYNPNTGTYVGYDGIERPCP